MLRIYLTGSLRLEAGEILIGERQFPGHQGRLAAAYLVTHHGRTVSRDALASVVWPTAPPPSWDVALSAIISNLRSLFSRVGLSRSDVITHALGCYSLRLPSDSWIDTEAAVQAIDRAEGAMRTRDPGRAFGWVGVATAIARRPFLPGEEGEWVESQRDALQHILVRSLDCFTEVLLWNGEPVVAIRRAEEAVATEPFRESGYRRLMRVHAQIGNRAEAVRVYERCRKLLAAQLGVDPSTQTEAMYLDVLNGILDSEPH